MAYITGTRRPSLTLGARFSEIFSALGTAYAQWRVYRRTLAALQDLSDRELDDLGLSRGTLDEAAHNAAYGEARTGL